jgi:transcription antitermination protein NusB
MTSKARRKPRPSKKARSASRLGAVQALYQMEVSDQGSEAALREFLDHRLGAVIEGDRYAEADTKFFTALVRGVVERQDEIDRILATSLVKGWELERLDTTLRAALRTATYELIARDDVPPKVIIDEYVEIARAFFDEGEELSFLNGVLHRIAMTHRPGDMPAAEA